MNKFLEEHWKITRGDGYWQILRRAPQSTHGELVVGNVMGSNWNIGDDMEAHCRARLMASAPSMLEALESILKNRGTEVLHEIAQDAIAKAKEGL